MFALGAILVVNVIALIALVIFDGDRYEEEARRIEKELMGFHESTHPSASKTLYVRLFDATTFIILDKNTDGNILRFMEPALRERIKKLRDRQKGRLLLLWINGNHTLLRYHDCTRISSYLNIQWGENIFAGNGYVRLRVSNGEFLEKNVKVRQLRIQ